MFVGNDKTDFTHKNNVRETVTPIVLLFYVCVSVVIEIRLVIDLVGM